MLKDDAERSDFAKLYRLRAMLTRAADTFRDVYREGVEAGRRSDLCDHSAGVLWLNSIARQQAADLKDKLGYSPPLGYAPLGYAPNVKEKSAKLSRCPCCGSLAESQTRAGDGVHRVYCYHCGMSTPWCAQLRYAFDIWNHRDPSAGSIDQRTIETLTRQRNQAWRALSAIEDSVRDDATTIICLSLLLAASRSSEDAEEYNAVIEASEEEE